MTNLSSVGVDSIDELVEDCGSIPAALRACAPQLPLSRLAAAWTVSDACADTVRDFDEYV